MVWLRRRRRDWVWAGVLVGLPAVGLPVLAQGPPAGGPAAQSRPRLVLQAIDQDGDGQLSAAEIAGAADRLKTLDRNGDGELTADEMEPPRPDAGVTPQQMVAVWMGFDRNGDGVLTRDEVPERMQALFARADADGDGRLTKEELTAAARRTGAPGGLRKGPGSAAGMMRLDPVLLALDTDHDGVISAAEMRAAGASLLTLDANHDGRVDAGEMRVRQQTPEERADHLLGEWDTNKDGVLSEAEAPDGLRPRFKAADVNGDGVLDRAEVVAMYAAQSGAAGQGSQGQGSQAGQGAAGAPAATGAEGRK